jgi:trehalose 6-phosphate synthase
VTGTKTWPGEPSCVRLTAAETGGKPEDPTTRDGQRLIVVSNRVPVPAKERAASAGGLAVALQAVLKQRGGLWFGWSGKTVEDASGSDSPHVRDVGNITFAVVDLSKRELDSYYAGFSNRALWPICHFRLDLLHIEREDTAGYFGVNERLAQSLEPLLRPNDLIWVHDYHLIPFGSVLRGLGITNRIGFFLHIPWPPSDVASALPAYTRFLNSFTAYDVIGLQTPRDADNLAQCLIGEGIARATGNGTYEAHGRHFVIAAFPIGIDTAGFIKTAQDAERDPLVRRMHDSMDRQRLIIGVDRLDYSKGIPQRIQAVDCFLKTHPNARTQVRFLQITPKSRSEVSEYRKMQREIAEQIGRVNGAWGDVDWVPIRYINKTVRHASLAGLYRMARVGLVTPLRDGMNLVAKEFVAAQPEDDPGVLVLSRFAGAAHELATALLVNPYDAEATAAAIARALEMPLEERKERWAVMMAVLAKNGIHQWYTAFLAALGSERAVGPEI